MVKDVPTAFEARRLWDFDAAWEREARAFITGKARSLYIYGGLGVGKSALACAMVMEAREAHRVRALYRTFRAYGNEMTGNGWQEPFWWDSVTMFAVDDVGKPGEANEIRGRLSAWLDHRHTHNLKTIITGNVPISELHTILDGRAVSRLQEDGPAWEMTGPDRRLAGKDGAR